MTTVVSIDGRIVAAEEACVSVFDRGFLYGDSIFETVRTYGGRPFALRAHLDRLGESARRVLIELPADAERLEREVTDALAAAGNSESYVRIMITRGIGPMGLDPADATSPCRVIFVGELQTPPAESYANGVGVVTLRTQRAADATAASGAKVANYLVAILALKAARDAGAHECLVVDSQGRVVEGANSNVFALLGDELITPPPADGPLLGITRALILDVAREAGTPVVERSLPVEMLGQARELFISSSLREILPVTRCDGRSVGDGVPGPATRILQAAFRRKVAEIHGLEG